MNPSTTDTITLGGGCFWCLEAVYEKVDGVTAVESGYANGHAKNPSYEQVCGGDTGHAEVVRVTFDTSRITLREILEIFFTIHDPTTLNRQGNDVGTQYRSGIYFHDAAQERVARDGMASLCGDAHAPMRWSSGRERTYAYDSTSLTLSTRPSMRTTRSSSIQWNCSAANGCAASSRPLRLS